MGLFSSPSENRREAVRSGTAVPTRSERLQCWAARDAYFACLDTQGIVDAHAEGERAARACGAQTAAFERDCARQWVKYFKDWRVADEKKRKRIEALQKEGAEPIDISVRPVN
ncbi:cytochrome c oxidase, subunit VIb [Ceratocystis lukuohia]|uniref:Cytochrome c oxidase subunit 6B-like protein new16 n=3 Tax=Ceratocystis TaxID=5157 RepID=A0A0F8B1C6_CERFI|nr:Cytochrome c oxidase subunit 6B-like protein new16 [Ceratocystis platani]PHH54843.1 Cytochrome c oxidase subunit 6B-like protein new16 [Ceratocystis fimbriata CBS 114723]